MPDATIITLADAVVAALNGETMSQDFTATRAYRPVHDLEDLTTLTVVVIPTSWVSGNRDRSSSDDIYRIDIGIQKAIDTTSNTAMDAMMYLEQEIMDFLAKKALSSPNATCTIREMIPGADAGYAIESLDQTFLGVIRTTWRLLA